MCTVVIGYNHFTSLKFCLFNPNTVLCFFVALVVLEIDICVSYDSSVGTENKGFFFHGLRQSLICEMMSRHQCFGDKCKEKPLVPVLATCHIFPTITVVAVV